MVFHEKGTESSSVARELISVPFFILGLLQIHRLIRENAFERIRLVELLLMSKYQSNSASGLDFIVLYLEYDMNPDVRVLAWADSLLKAYPTRRAIVVSHFILK